MPRISSYPTVAPAAGDLLIASDVSGSDNPTKTVTAQSIGDLDPVDTLSAVLTAGNTATNNIILTGNFTGTGNITRTGDIALTGDAGVSGTLDVTGLSTLGSLDVTTSTVIGTTLGVTGLSTLATVDINGGNIDGTNIGVAVQGTGTFTTMTATTSILGTLGGNVNHNNFNSTNVDIDSGKIDGTQIGSAVAATVRGTTITATTDFVGPIGNSSPSSGIFTTITGSGNMTIDTDTLFVNATTNRVGVGTASPSVRLHAQLDGAGALPSIDTDTVALFQRNLPGSSSAAVSIIGHIAGESIVKFGDAGDEDIGRIRYQHADDSMDFFTNNTEAMTITEAQRVGIGTSAPNTSAILHLSSTTRGFVPPVMTQAQRLAIGSPTAGLMVFETTTSKLWVYTGAQWEEITSAP